MSKKRFYPLRDADDPHKITLIPITEEQYRALYKDICHVQNHERYYGRCMCPKYYLWKCDGQCDLCEYHKSDTVSLDEPLEEGNRTLRDCVPEQKKAMEDIIADRLLLETLLTRLRELDPDADEIIALWEDNPGGISDRAIAAKLGRPQRTFARQMKRYREELRKLLGDE